MEWLKAIQWDHPAIVAAVGGVFLIAAALLKRKKHPDDRARIKIENKPSNVLKSTVKVGLDEKDVGQEVGKAIDPLRQDMASVSAGIQALSDQLATAQLAPKQPVTVSDDPLKIKAVEFYNAGVDAYQQDEIGQALGHWRDVLQLDPHYAAAHNNLGVALKAKGELDAAIENYNAALRIDPDYAIAHSNLGSALAAKGELDAAIECYKEALRIEPDCASAHNNLGNALQDKGDPDAAIEHYNAALRIDPDDARAHDNLAIALAQKGDAAAAVTALAKAIELDERYRAWAKTDTNYDSIRDDPAFRKLVYGE